MMEDSGFVKRRTAQFESLTRPKFCNSSLVCKTNTLSSAKVTCKPTQPSTEGGLAIVSPHSRKTSPKTENDSSSSSPNTDSSGQFRNANVAPKETANYMEKAVNTIPGPRTTGRDSIPSVPGPSTSIQGGTSVSVKAICPHTSSQDIKMVTLQSGEMDCPYEDVDGPVESGTLFHKQRVQSSHSTVKRKAAQNLTNGVFANVKPHSRKAETLKTENDNSSSIEGQKQGPSSAISPGQSRNTNTAPKTTANDMARAEYANTTPTIRREGRRSDPTVTRPSLVIQGGTIVYVEAICPYATSNDPKLVAMQSEEVDCPYEDVAVPVMSDTLVDKQIFNFICQFEATEFSKFGVLSCHLPQEGTPHRMMLVMGTSKTGLEDFFDFYNRIESKLWVEGFKASTTENLDHVLNQIQSKFKCICSRPESDNVEVLCLREDSEKLKQTIKQNGGSGVHYIYEMEKSVEVATYLAPNNSIKYGFCIKGIKVYIHRSDITNLKVGAIVNAANERLIHGSGVAKAIETAGGPKFSRSCVEYIKKEGPLKVSGVAKTSAGNLQCQMVLNAVGPKVSNAKCKQQLEETFRNVFEYARKSEVHSIAIPPISSGKFGVPGLVVADTLAKVLQNLPQNSQCKVIHVVDVRDDVLQILREILDKRRGSVTGDELDRIDQSEVDAAVTEVQTVVTPEAKQKSWPMRKFYYKFRALFVNEI